MKEKIYSCFYYWKETLKKGEDGSIFIYLLMVSKKEKCEWKKIDLLSMYKNLQLERMIQTKSKKKESWEERRKWRKKERKKERNESIKIIFF